MESNTFSFNSGRKVVNPAHLIYLIYLVDAHLILVVNGLCEYAVVGFRWLQMLVKVTSLHVG